MIFPEEKYSLGGDQYLSIYFGDEGSLEENVFTLAHHQAIQESKIVGIIDSVVTASSILIRYDPFQIDGMDLVRQIKEIGGRVRKSKGKIRIPSALVSVPMLYDDPWTRECARFHQVPPNLETIAKFNGLASPEEVIRIHSSETYWVRYVGGPGLIGLIPFRPQRVLLAPKYERPRGWTPSRTFGLGGHVTSYYPFEMPGGIQLLGRLPVPLFDPLRSHPAFEESPTICQIGYRIRFRPIDRKEYDDLEKNFQSYRYEVKRDLFEYEMKGEERV